MSNQATTPDWNQIKEKASTKLVVYWKDSNQHHPFYSFPNKKYHEGIRHLRKLAEKFKAQNIRPVLLMLPTSILPVRND